MTYGFIYSKLLPDGSKERAKTHNISFSSLDEKFEFLQECSAKGILTGVPACELLEHAGKKNIMWVDIDTPNYKAFKLWEQSEAFPITGGSYAAIKSATGNIHMYVSTDRKLSVDECFSMGELIRESAPMSIRPFIDRIYGPDNLEPIFIPGTAQKLNILPQSLLENIHGIYTIPSTIEGSEFREWQKRTNYKL